MASPSGRRRVTAALLVIAAAAGAAGWRLGLAPSSVASTQAAPAPAVPVQVAAAARRDVPLYLAGLGTVQAFNTVTIKSRVDGQLQKVAFVEGQDVKAGDLLAQIDPRPFQAALDQAIAKKNQDEAQLANAKLDLQRYTDLSTRSFASKQQLDTQRATVAQLTAQVQGDDAAIDNARTQLGYTRITAPLDGRTGIRLVDEGNVVHATDTTGLVVLAQLHPISVIFTLPEDQLGAVKAAMASGAVPLRAGGRGAGDVPATGTLALIDNQIDQTTGTIRLKGTFPNTDGALWPGEFVTVRLLAQTASAALTVPEAALQRGPQGYYAYVVKPDDTVEQRSLDVGDIADGTAIVKQGLADGERVVTAGQYRVAPGVRVAATTGDAAG